MKEILQKYNFKWKEKDKLPLSWTEGAFHGNATLGIQIYFVEKDDDIVLHIELGSHDVYDRRETRDFWMGKQFDNPRLPIGCLEYSCGKEIEDFSMETSLYDAVTNLYIRSEKGEIACKLYVCAQNNMVVIEQEKGSLKEWKLIPYEAISPRQMYGLEKREAFRVDDEYQYNEKPILYKNEVEVWSEQNLTNDWKTITFLRYEDNKILVKVGQEEGLSCMKLKEELYRDIEVDYWKHHINYWHSYYPISGLSIPDKELEEFYYRQIYKLGCVVREESRVIDNQGPWISMTPWPGTWWNLNVQLCYWPLYTSNRLAQARSLNRYLLEHKQDLIENVPKQYQHDSAGMGTCTTWNLKSKIADPTIDNGLQFVELGNLTWVMHNCFLYYKMSMDEELLRELVYPILRRCVNYYLHFIIEGKDGKIHLPATSSPEYGQVCEDCNYDLSLLYWGCETLLECTKILELEDEKEVIWKDIVERLVDYPINETGYMIGKALPYAKSHRHFSHLMMHVPLYLVNRDNSDSWELIKKSVEHWFSYKGDIKGFSYVGASLIASAYQKGDIAVQQLKDLFREQITPNTMYQEEGPVMETPLAAAECIQQLLLQSWGGKIRIFPALPKDWKNASFHGFAAQGGFIVSAQYQNGKTKSIIIKSIAGGTCTVETDIKNAKIIFEDGKIQKADHGKDLTFTLNKNETIKIEAF